MVNEGRYFEELQKVIGDTKSADMINERWNEVLERLDQLSIEYAKELQELSWLITFCTFLLSSFLVTPLLSLLPLVRLSLLSLVKLSTVWPSAVRSYHNPICSHIRLHSLCFDCFDPTLDMVGIMIINFYLFKAKFHTPMNLNYNKSLVS